MPSRFNLATSQDAREFLPSAKRDAPFLVLVYPFLPNIWTGAANV